jgi:hypothetical protein
VSFTTPKIFSPHYGFNQDITYALDAATNSGTLDDYLPQWTFCFKTLIHPQNIYFESRSSDASLDYLAERDPDRFRFVLNSVIPTVYSSTVTSNISQVIDFVPFLLTNSSLSKINENPAKAYPGYGTVTLGTNLYRFIATACTAPGFTEAPDNKLYHDVFDHPDHVDDMFPRLISGLSPNNQNNYEVYATHTSSSLAAPGTMVCDGIEYKITEFQYLPVLLANTDPFVAALPWVTAEDVKNAGCFNQHLSGVSPASEVQGNSRIASIAITQDTLHTTVSYQTCGIRLQAFSTYTSAGNRVV